MKLLSGNSNLPLAEAISRYLEVPLTRANVRRFADEEIFVEILENVRGEDVFVVQSTSYPANDNLMELLICIDALRRASARRITAVMPYFGYARQDRKPGPRTPISAKLVANLLTTAGANRILSVDLHAGQIQGFFDIPVDNLKAMPILADYFRQKNLGDNVVVVAPDVGGVARAREMAERLGTTLAILDKRRPEPNVAEVHHVIGDVKEKIAIMVDDLIDTGGTITRGATALLEAGATKVYACCTHPVFSHPAVELLIESPIEEVVVTNTIPLGLERPPGKIKVLSVAPLFGEAIRRIFEELSVSRLFD